MIDEYTPTTSDLCDAWGYFRHEGTDWGNPDYCAGFNRWLNQIKAEAWEQGRESTCDECHCQKNPYRSEQ